MESKSNYVISADLEPDRPIKVARDINQSHDLKYLFENDVGGGATDKLVTSAVAIPQFFSRKKSKRRAYRILFDSGSDGDILFARKRVGEYVPAKLRMAPQKWRTSCGVFETSKVGEDLEFLFPEFSETRTYRVSPDIFELPASADKPTYDLIIGVKTMQKWNTVLNIDQELININHQTLTIQDFESLGD